jgi:hypothetical protein
MLHSAIENGRIYLLRIRQGAGPYLVRNGFVVYPADLRGPISQKWVAHSWGGVLFSSFMA